MKKFGILVIALSFLVVGMAMAAYLPPETPETSVISSVGTVKCTGTTFVNTDAVVDVSKVSGGCGGTTGSESIGVYTNDLLAKGNTDYASSITVDTANKLDNQNNIETAQLLNYAGPGAIYSEDLFMMASGDGAKSNTMCPFGTNAPAFCSKVEANVNFMGKALDYQSAGGIRTIAKTQDTPAEFSFGESAVGSGVFDVQYSAKDLEARKMTKVDVDYPIVIIHTIYHPQMQTPSPAAVTDFDQRYRAVGNFDVNTAFSYTSGMTL